MPSDLERQAADMPCPEPTDCQGHHHDKCPCEGTSLRYPTLSRECWCLTYKWENESSRRMLAEGRHIDCNGSSRIPDVILEKVLKEVSKLGSFQLHCVGGRHGFNDTYWIVLENKEYQDYTEPIPAALAALLATTPVPLTP